MILRRGLRAAVKIVRGWLAEPEPAVENCQLGDPPYTYEQTHQLFKDHRRGERLWTSAVPLGRVAGY